MIGPSGTVRVMVATKPVDFRKGMEGLAMLVREHMKADPFSGAVYVFRAKRADRFKLIFWDGTGFGKFIWPSASAGAVSISAAQMAYMREGIDWRKSTTKLEAAERGLSGRNVQLPAFEESQRARYVIHCVAWMLIVTLFRMTLRL